MAAYLRSGFSGVALKPNRDLGMLPIPADMLQGHPNLQVDLLTAHLATAHIPLALLVLGVSMDLGVPRGQQVGHSALRCALPYRSLSRVAGTSTSHSREALKHAARDSQRVPTRTGHCLWE